MAKYTIELRDVIKTRNIFDFSYPFYDESKRAAFEERFIKHFYFDEIGAETIDRFIHFLEDKMNTVFPMYNAMLKASTIEYDVLDNYKLSETYEREVDTEDKQKNVHSEVGRLRDERIEERNDNRTTDNNGKVTSNGTSNDRIEDNGSVVKDSTSEGNSVKDTTTSGTNTEETNETSTKNSEGTVDSTNVEVRKHLDTPQGATDLDSIDYLTTLDKNTTTNNQDSTGKETNTGERSVNGSSSGTGKETVTSENEGNETTTTGNVRVGEGSTSNIQNSENTEVSNGEEKTTSQGEQFVSNDSNSRILANGKRIEKYTLTRRGNIGVDTDSDGIEKHIRLQKTLANIEKMFFTECEDLFMLVY